MPPCGIIGKNRSNISSSRGEKKGMTVSGSFLDTFYLIIFSNSKREPSMEIQ
jgi:hypothetical protein